MSVRGSQKTYYKLYKSSRPGKKYDIYLPPSFRSGHARSGSDLKVSFGASGYQDYTMHKDEARKQRYQTRHQKDRINDPRYAGFWSWHVLWGPTTNLQTNLERAVARIKSGSGRVTQAQTKKRLSITRINKPKKQTRRQTKTIQVSKNSPLVKSRLKMRHANPQSRSVFQKGKSKSKKDN